MEKLHGRRVKTDALGDLASDFVTWAGENTAWVELVREPVGIGLKLLRERNADTLTVTATGLAGGGEAVGAWMDAEGYVVLDSSDDDVEVEAEPAEFPKVCSAVAAFLAPGGNWTVAEVTLRRKP